MSDQVRKAISRHYILAGLGLVLLACVWALGWMVSPSGLYEGKPGAWKLLLLTTIILAAWNLMSCVVAAGFFHAASVHTASTFKAYKAASFRLLFFGVIFVFPIPLASSVLGPELPGRILALFVIVISMAGILFGRARIRMIGRRLSELEALNESALTVRKDGLAALS